MASEISLSKDLIDMKARSNNRVYKSFETLIVCPFLFPNRTSLELKSLLSLFISFFKLGASRLGVRLNFGCSLYLDFYGLLVLKDVFLERERNVFALQDMRFLICET